MPYQPNHNDATQTADVRVGSVAYTLFGPSAAANLGSGVFTLPDAVSGDVEFKILGLSTETIGVTLSMDGTNYSAAQKVVSASTGLDTANATLANGTYKLPILRFGSPKYVKFTKSATTDVAAVAVCVPVNVTAY